MKMLELHLMFALPDGVETEDAALNAFGDYLVAYKPEPAITSRDPLPRAEFDKLSQPEQVERFLVARRKLWNVLLESGTKGRRFAACGGVVDATGLYVATERVPITTEEVEASAAP